MKHLLSIDINVKMSPWLLITQALLIATAACQTYSAATGKGQEDFLPILGLGTFGIGGWSIGEAAARNPAIINKTSEAVKMALGKGFRHLDTAMVYGNEKGVGMGIAAALQEGSVKREDIWISTKLWSTRYACKLVVLLTA
jgi:diketogulonate reductase-like aldo/keto reductase